MSPAGVCGFAGMNPSPMPAKERPSSVPSVVSKERKRLGVRKKPLKLCLSPASLEPAEPAEKDRKPLVDLLLLLYSIVQEVELR